MNLIQDTPNWSPRRETSPSLLLGTHYVLILMRSEMSSIRKERKVATRSKTVQYSARCVYVFSDVRMCTRVHAQEETLNAHLAVNANGSFLFSGSSSSSSSSRSQKRCWKFRRTTFQPANSDAPPLAGDSRQDFPVRGNQFGREDVVAGILSSADRQSMANTLYVPISLLSSLSFCSRAHLSSRVRSNLLFYDTRVFFFSYVYIN